ncbi:MAG: hypothetical protein ABI678_12185 [Kofleriaceae bacterium]
MKRLLVVALVAACGKSDSSPEPLPSRAEGAKTASTQKASTAAFCDIHKADDSGPLLQLPALGEYKIVAKPNTWTWINVWATWCKPCVEEMPRLAAWQAKLAKPVSLEFVSVDDSDDVVAVYQKEHHDPPRSARLVDPAAKEAWVTNLGLDAAAPIPIHIFVSPAGHVRCVRAGSIRESDFAAVQLLLAE